MTTRERSALQLRDVFRSGQRETLVALHRLWHRRVARFRASTVVDQSGRDGADPRLRRIGWSPGRTTDFQFCGILFGWARVVCAGKRRTDGGPVQTLAKSITCSDIHSNRSSLTERNSQQPITSSSRPTRGTCRLITLHPPFLIPQKVKFRYRLDGYDRDWHEAGTRRQAFYTDLPPGKYSFRVIACNSDGVWNDKRRQAGFLRRSCVLPDELVPRSMRVPLSGAAMDGLPITCPAIASAVRHDSGGASR